jgi:hypothetical protein
MYTRLSVCVYFTSQVIIICANEAQNKPHVLILGMNLVNAAVTRLTSVLSETPLVLVLLH